METRLTTLAPPAMVLAASAPRSPNGQAHGALDAQVQGGGEAVGVPLVAAVGEVGPGVVDQDVERLEPGGQVVDRSVVADLAAVGR